MNKRFNEKQKIHGKNHEVSSLEQIPCSYRLFEPEEKKGWY
jgi:hypothetical protein